MALSLRKVAAALAITGIVVPGVSIAQEGAIEEIVVTAAKRAQTLQDIPIAVSVTSAETIEQAQIQDLIDLQSVVPSLRVSQLQVARNSSFSIRGFGNGANNIGIEPSVGIFVDGVYRSRAASAISDLPRLERVEVLSGPQSTLFGKNASAGVVSVVTPKPSGDSGGFISGSFGNRSAVVLKGLYEGAINDNLTFDVSGSYNKRDGFFENRTLNSDLNERDRYSVFGQLVWTPSDTSSIRFLADYGELDERCCGVVNILSGPATLAINALGGQLVPNDPDAEFGFFDDDSINQITNFGASIQGDFEFDNFTVTSITSFRNSESFDNQDIDFSSADLTNGNVNDINIDTFTQEIRFASNGDGAVDWLVGGFYFDESIEQFTNVLFGPVFRPFLDIGITSAGLPSLGQVEGLIGLPQGSFFQTNSGSFDNSTLDNKAISFFGQLDWHINDALTATLGLNYTDDEKDFSIQSTTTEVRGNLILPGLLGLIPTNLSNTIDIPNAVEPGRTSDDDVTYTARLAWDINDDLNVYASYATGFKASSIDLLRDSRPTVADFAALQALGLADPNSEPGTRFASPEEAEVFEIGLKTRFDRGSLNVAIFDQTLDNFQSAIFLGTSFALTNAERQSVTGAEIDFKYLPTDALSLGLSATILDPLFDSFTESASGDLSGQQPAGIPELALSLSAQYQFSINGWDSYIRGDFQYEDEVQVVDNISADIASREVKLLNVAAGISTGNGLSFTLWARNLADEAYLISAFPSVAQAGSVSGYRNEPRTYGISLRKDF